MHHIHRMKEKVAHELSKLCEDGLDGDMEVFELKMMNLLAELHNELHEACHVLHRAKKHEGAQMNNHYEHHDL